MEQYSNNFLANSKNLSSISASKLITLNDNETHEKGAFNTSKSFEYNRDHKRDQNTPHSKYNKFLDKTTSSITVNTIDSVSSDSRPTQSLYTTDKTAITLNYEYGTTEELEDFNINFKLNKPYVCVMELIIGNVSTESLNKFYEIFKWKDSNQTSSLFEDVRYVRAKYLPFDQEIFEKLIFKLSRLPKVDSIDIEYVSTDIIENNNTPNIVFSENITFRFVHKKGEEMVHYSYKNGKFIKK
jgi:hypothetical protein